MSGIPGGLNCSTTPWLCRLREEIVSVVLTISRELALERPIGLLLWIKLITFEKTESFMLNCSVSLVGIYNGDAI